MVELLAPAGDKECFIAALTAGADAIYVGGKRYGARAYAGNFEESDLIECIQLAHLHGKKVYLTVNTLMKETEIDGLTSFLRPFYEEGLDGVIVQDFGALQCIAEAFPQLELHASTQMTITGAYGAKLLKKYGVSRVVPARELSLSEIVEIKEKTGLEIETFVHGAMCYGYSGQCLFSSMMGERSGNRGRCAGPCRLPYTVKYEGKQQNRDNEMYQLSLKDLCTLEVLPKLIEAGIDSFKIEGRMKTPEYVAFVTGMYRKYIDLYMAAPESYRVNQEDMNLLRRRFSRGSIQPGYYFTHNGRELVTLDKPGYQSFESENATAETDAEKKNPEIKVNLIGYFSAQEGVPISFTVYKEDASETAVVVYGEEATGAQNCPALPEEVQRQLSRTGNTPFSFCEITVELSGNLFLPKKILNELRRRALSELTDGLLKTYRRQSPCNPERMKEAEIETEIDRDKRQKDRAELQVQVRTMEQLKAAEDCEGMRRVYLSTDIFSVTSGEKKEMLLEIRGRFKTRGVEFYLVLPHVCRRNAIKIMDKNRVLIEQLQPDGFCVGNPESLAYIQEAYPNKNIVSDAGLYVFNSKTAEFLAQESIVEHILPYELHRQEILQLLTADAAYGHRFVLPVYGYIPVMETAGCLLKTNHACRHGKGREDLILTDRHKKDRIVLTHCDRCENTIYNSVPLSLHKEVEKILAMPLSGIVLMFSTENASQTKRLLKFWQNPGCGDTEGYVKEFTKGHFMKSVE